MASQAAVGNAIATGEADSQLGQTHRHGRQPGDDNRNSRPAPAGPIVAFGNWLDSTTAKCEVHGCQPGDNEQNKVLLANYKPTDYGCVPRSADETASSSFVTRMMNRRHLVHGMLAAGPLGSTDQRFQQPTGQVPPCIAGTVLGVKLLDRMLTSDWLLITEEDVPPCESGWVPVEPSARIKHERDLGLREAKTSSCAFCQKAAASKKCTTCWITYYCDQECQHKHWKQHKLDCVAPVWQAKEEYAIAVPEYECFCRYKVQCQRAGSLEHSGPDICVLGESTFIRRFGEAQLLRTCLTLAYAGKPAMTCMTVIATPTWTTPLSPERLSQLQSQFPDVVCAYTPF